MALVRDTVSEILDEFDLPVRYEDTLTRILKRLYNAGLDAGYDEGINDCACDEDGAYESGYDDGYANAEKDLEY